MGANWDAEVKVFPAFAFFSAFLVCIPLYWHLEAWNTGCVMLIFWFATGNLVRGINTLVWRGTAANMAPVWCDISTHFDIGLNVGALMAMLVIVRRLYLITRIQSVSVTVADRRRAVYVDLALCWGIPILQMALYWVIQGQRYDIYEDVGPTPDISTTHVTWVLYDFWPLGIALSAAVYCLLALNQFRKRHVQFQSILSSGSSFTMHRYYRLIALVGTYVLYSIPLSAYVLSQNIKAGVYPYHIKDIHWDFSHVRQYPKLVWQQNPLNQQNFEFQNWSLVACAFGFFMFFGLAEEARRHYHVAFTTIAKTISRGSFNGTESTGDGTKHSKPTLSSLGRITIPSFVNRSRRRSIASFVSDDRLSSSISVGDVSVIDDRKLLPYSPTYSSGSSTCVPSPISEKAIPEKFEPPMVAHPDPVLDLTALSRMSFHSSIAPHNPDAADMV